LKVTTPQSEAEDALDLIMMNFHDQPVIDAFEVRQFQYVIG